MSETKQGVCPRCSLDGDKSIKTLYKCPYCGEYFCTKHMEPRLIMSFQTYQNYLQRAYSEGKIGLAMRIAEEWKKIDGHPCFAYTEEFWRQYEEGQIFPRKLRINATTKAEKPRESRCEFCGKIIDGIPYRCPYCGGTFCAEHHLPPNHNCPGIDLWKARTPPGISMRYTGSVVEALNIPESSHHRLPVESTKEDSSLYHSKSGKETVKPAIISDKKTLVKEDKTPLIRLSAGTAFFLALFLVFMVILSATLLNVNNPTIETFAGLMLIFSLVSIIVLFMGILLRLIEVKQHR